MSVLGNGLGTGYPGAIDTARSVANNVDTVVADDVNDQNAAILAIEATLGTNPQGVKSTVKQFLQVEHNTDGTHDLTSVVSLDDTQIITGTKLFRRINYAADTGSANAIIVSPTGTGSASDLVDGFHLWVLANATNNGATTLNYEGVGAKTCVKTSTDGSLSNLVANDVIQNRYHLFIYDSSLDQFILKVKPRTLATDLDANAVVWTDNCADATAGDLPIYDENGAPELLSIGTTGQSLRVQSTGKLGYENDGRGWVFLEEQEASSSSNLILNVGFGDSSYTAIKLVFEYLLPSALASYNMTASDDDQVSWISSYSYSWELFDSDIGASTAVSNGTTNIPLNALGISNTAAQGGLNGEINIFNPSNATSKKHFILDLVFGRSGSVASFTGAGYINTTNALTDVRVVPTSGNLSSGYIRSYGLKNSAN